MDKDDVHFAFEFAGYVLLLLLVPVGMFVLVRLSEMQFLILVIAGHVLLVVGAIVIVSVIKKEIAESRITQTMGLVFDEERRVLSCPDGREFPFSRVRFDIQRILGYSDSFQQKPSTYWVYIWVGTNVFYLESFTDLTEARRYAYEVGKKLSG